MESERATQYVTMHGTPPCARRGHTYAQFSAGRSVSERNAGKGLGLARCEIYPKALRPAHDMESQGRTDRPASQLSMQGVHAVDWGIVHSDDEVARPEVRGRGGSVVVPAENLNGSVDRQVQSPHETQVEGAIPHGHAQIGTPHAAASQDLGQYPLRRRRRNRESNSLRRCNDRGVNANDATAGINQWPAGIAGIQGGGMLHDAFDQTAVATAKRAAYRADDSRGHGRLEAQWIAHGHDQLPRAQRRCR